MPAFAHSVLLNTFDGCMAQFIVQAYTGLLDACGFRLAAQEGLLMVRELIEQVLRTKDPQILLSLVPLFQSRTYAKGDVLLMQGETWRKAFFVERGLLRM